MSTAICEERSGSRRTIGASDNPAVLGGMRATCSFCDARVPLRPNGTLSYHEEPGAGLADCPRSGEKP